MDEGLVELATQLWAARRDRLTIDGTRFRLPVSTDEAYAVQHHIVSLSGSTSCGYKIGSTSKEAQAFLGTTGPSAGALLRPFLFESPAVVEVAADHSPAVEGEFAFRVGRQLQPREAPYTTDEVSAAIECVAGSIEVVGSRFAGGLGGQGRLLTTADGSANVALVVGPWHPWRDQDLRQHGVAMTIDGVLGGSGFGERALGNPLNALNWLTDLLSDSGVGLQVGDVVATGTCTGLHAVHPGSHVRADFGVFGDVEITFA
jgi:2-keto-4-pentenoate hydratase